MQDNAGLHNVCYGTLKNTSVYCIYVVLYDVQCLVFVQGVVERRWVTKVIVTTLAHILLPTVCAHMSKSHNLFEVKFHQWI